MQGTKRIAIFIGYYESEILSGNKFNSSCGYDNPIGL